MLRLKNPPKLFNDALQRLTRKQECFQEFDSFWDWVMEEDDDIVDKEIGYFEVIKSLVLRTYLDKRIYVSPSALDNILFNVIKSSPISRVLRDIDIIVTKNHLKRNSVVIFPLHSFGFQFGGLGNIMGHQSLEYTYQDFRVFSQTNSFRRTTDAIMKYLHDINFLRWDRLDTDLFRHYFETRHLAWFERNPVLLHHFKFSQYQIFDNLHIIMERIDFTTNKLYFIAALAPESSQKGAEFSTRTTNNFETLDIDHFLTVTNDSKRPTLNCIPIHFSQFRINERMRLNIDLLPSKRVLPSWQTAAIRSIDDLYTGYLKFIQTKHKRFAKYYRVSNSLNYFRKSVRAVTDEDRIININTAFETLLLDRHENNKKSKMVERFIKGLEKGADNGPALQNLQRLIDDRNEIIHDGLPSKARIDFRLAYEQYCKLVLFTYNNISKMNSSEPHYLTTFYDFL